MLAPGCFVKARGPVPPCFILSIRFLLVESLPGSPVGQDNLELMLEKRDAGRAGEGGESVGEANIRS